MAGATPKVCWSLICALYFSASCCLPTPVCVALEHQISADGVANSLCLCSLGVPDCRALICSELTTVWAQIDQIALPLKSLLWN